MGTEIERRWLVPYPDLGLVSSQGIESKRKIEQGYLEMGSPLKSLRVRIYDNADAVITGKTGIGMEREENEEELPLPAAQMLMRYAHHRLAKVRYRTGMWDVDVFRGPLGGIVLAEFESVDRRLVLAAQPPDWMGNAIEVTDSLSNLHLARMATDLEGSGMDPLATVLARIQAPPIPKIVITGGPGSGKSTIMGLLRQQYPDLQFVPEVATIVIAQLGINAAEMEWIRFQRTIWRIQKIFEMTSADFAATTHKRAVVLDRGSVDNAAYMMGGISAMESLFQTTAAAEYGNYDLVIDLAVPPRDVYEAIRGNNPARRETFSEALLLGNGITQAWAGHPRHVPIGNHDGWDGKVAAVRRELDRLLAKP